MKCIAQMIAFGALVLGTSSFGLAGDKKKDEEKKVPKADVVVKNDAKTASAKAGQLVQIDINYPVIPPFPSDFVVMVDGKKVKSETITGVVTNAEGKPVIGAGVNMVQFKAEGDGKQKVVVEYKKGEEKAKREIELEVTK